MTIDFFLQMTTPEEITPTERSFKELYNVSLSDPLTPQVQIENSPLFPERFEPHKKRKGFYCINATLAQPIESPNIRPLEILWATKIPAALLQGGKPTYDDNPTNRPAVITWDNYKTSKPVMRLYERTLKAGGGFAAGYDRTSDAVNIDKNGNIAEPEHPAINTAGDLIALSRQMSFRVISFEKNVKSLPLFFSKSGDYLNSDTVKLRGVEYKPHSLMATDIKVSDWQFEFGIQYLILSWNFFVDEVDFWYIRKRNVGFNEKVAVYYDSDKNPVPAPVPGGSVQHVLRPIVVGPVDNRHYPSQPVLLRPNGGALRTKRKGDSSDPLTWTGEVMTTESRDDDSREQSQKDLDWKQSEIQMCDLPSIPFNKYFPMK